MTSKPICLFHPCTRILRTLVISLISLFILTHTVNAAPITIYYPRSTAQIDPHYDYLLELLKASLLPFPGKYRLIPTDAALPQTRSINEAAAAHGEVDLLWAMTTDERENSLLPIRIPIDKGLIGWRIALVRHEKQQIFSQVRSLKDLAPFVAGQVHDWPDTDILRANGLNVEASSTYEALFKMLDAGRFDYFPRAVFEIWRELDAHPELAIEAEPGIVIHYPTAYYFFVSPRQPAFAADLRKGLELLLSNGHFEKIFQKYYREALQKSRLRQRIVIELRNPLLQQNKLTDNHPEMLYKP